VLGQQVFDLRRVDVFAAGDDHVLGTADDGVAAVRRLARQIAAVEPALGVHGGPIWPVMADHRRRAQQNFADTVRAGRQTDLHTQRRPAARTGVAGGLSGRQGDRERSGFRGAVHIAHGNAPLQERIDQRSREDTGASPDRAQRGEVGPGPVGVVDHCLHGCRHLQGQGGTVVPDRGQRRARLKARMQQHRRPGHQGRQGLDTQSADMKQWQYRQYRVVPRQGLGRNSGQHVGQQIGMGVGSAFGFTGSPRGVDQQDRRIRPGDRNHRAKRRGSDQGFDRISRQRPGPRQFTRLRLPGLVKHQAMGIAVSQDRLPFRRGQPVIEWHQNCAESAQCEQQHQLIHVVETQPGNAVTGSDAPFIRQAGRGPLSAPGQFAVAVPCVRELDGG
jgi:hypothetical protein